MKRKTFIYAALFLVTIGCTNCATIIRGSKQQVIILSEPKKANIEIDGSDAGQTPLVARLERRKTHVVKISLDGYAPYEMTLNKKLNGWIFGNILFGGLIGIAVDIATGSMYSLRPKDVNATFNTPLTSFKDKDTIHLTLVMSPDPSWQKIGQLSHLPAERAMAR